MECAGRAPRSPNWLQCWVEAEARLRARGEDSGEAGGKRPALSEVIYCHPSTLPAFSMQAALCLSHFCDAD